jgi:hypothetical protein
MLKFPIAAAASAAIAFAAAAPSPVQAAAVHLTPAIGSLEAGSDVIDVRWRRHGWRGNNAWIALGAAGLGAAIASGAYSRPYPHYGYYGHDYGYAPYGYGYATPPAYAYSGPGVDVGDAWDRCRAQFRSLRADGTYTTYGGEQRLCPYLR